VCIYLDGLSNHIHGNPKTAEKDQRIRTWLRNNGYEVIEIAVSDLDDQGAMTRHFRRLAGYLRADDIRNSIKDDTSWFSRAEKKTRPETRSVYRLVHPKPENYFSTCIPLVPLKFAAGAFSDPQYFDHDSWEWVEIDTHRRIRSGMFVAQVVGKSMEPSIPDKSYCLFSAPVTGTRQGKTVVVQLSDDVDPETGERYTVKRYSSEKAATEDGSWRHLKVTLKPNNPDFEPIELTCEDEGSVQVVSELLEVLG
jgi:SOS-response transcriptional repressor LexA